MNYELLSIILGGICGISTFLSATLCYVVYKLINARKQDFKTMAAMERAMKYMSDRMNGQTNSVTAFHLPQSDPLFKRAMKLFETALGDLEQQFGITEEEVKNEGEIIINQNTNLSELNQKQLAIALKQYEAKGEFETCSKILTELEKRKVG